MERVGVLAGEGAVADFFRHSNLAGQNAVRVIDLNDVLNGVFLVIFIVKNTENKFFLS
ncbi:MAG: hypothetical protein Q4A06_03490 [Cardiobacteriaceae bacterium]|nr:hypothetical protein [Cardiobacteriaceae bacterium]